MWITCITRVKGVQCLPCVCMCFIASVCRDVRFGYFPGPKLRVLKFVWHGNDQASDCEASSWVDIFYSLLNGRFSICK